MSETKKRSISFLVAFAGRMGSGKDTAVDHLIALAAKDGVAILRMSFASKLRECLEILTGIPAAKTRTVEEKAVIVTAKMLGLEDGGGKINKSIFQRLDEMGRALGAAWCGNILKAQNILAAAVAQKEPLTVGRLLQILGTEVGRDLLGVDVWVDALIKDWVKLGCPAAAVSDQRFPNEHKAIMGARNINRYKCGSTYLIDADERLAAASETMEAKTGRSATHASETSLLSIPRESFTAVITNNGTLDEFKAKIGNVWTVLAKS